MSYDECLKLIQQMRAVTDTNEASKQMIEELAKIICPQISCWRLVDSYEYVVLG